MTRLPHGAKACRNDECPDNCFKSHSCNGYTTAREKHKTIVKTAKHWKCKDPVARFCSLYNKYENCWMWKGQTTGFYSTPYYNLHGVTVRAAKVAWELYGDKIPKGKKLKRTCENSLCVNPKHHEII